ncbi:MULTISPECIES: hypothetical protein [Paraburkholderia]|uniref:YesK-like protein n=1 Tax=Paraburkholderia kururiensis TaxID=984307 RepID=A0ABZ0WIK8_9BURK|nr:MULTISPECIES: hypothetical protein [Paraburkholderia]WEY39740.1 hypothetical protein P2869_05075 [Paraburkholderia sp. SUR17]WQD77201.1 hypothetical protein U0042_24560 [Paraburkholderia kururiensis]
MIFRILSLPVALLFFAAFFLVRRYCGDERFKPLRIASYGFVFAGVGLIFGAMGWMDLGIFSVAIGICNFFVGVLVHMGSVARKRLPPPRDWDE